jgi:predicted nucleotidyltransferase
VDDRLVKQIIERICAVAQPERIVVFGSAARGDMGPDSDIDLLVIEREPGDIWRETVRLHQALRGLGYPFDLIVMAADRFEESKAVIGGIAYPAWKYGKTIYEAA